MEVAMRRLLGWCLLVPLISSAQLTTCLNTPQNIRGIATIPLKQTNSLPAFPLANRSPYQPAFGVSTVLVGGEGRTVPSFGVSYVPPAKISGTLVISGGFLWSSRSNTNLYDPRFLRTQRAQMAAPAEIAGTSAPSLGFGYVSAEYRYYLLRGEIEPYVGVGARALGGAYDARWGGAVAPLALAGVSARISDLFNGFAEIQHAPSIGLGFGGFDSVRGITTFAFGFSFAPHFARW
jgi:hypothetical protein